MVKLKLDFIIKHKFKFLFGGLLFSGLNSGIGVILFIIGLFGIILNFVDSTPVQIKKLKSTKVIGFSNKKLGKIKPVIENKILNDENIIYIVNGEAKSSFMTTGLDTIFDSGDVLIITSDRILINKGGTGKFFSGSFGEQIKSFYYKDITSIDTSSNFGKYRLEITVSGLSGNQSGFFSGNVSSENVFEFNKGLKNEMNEIEKHIQNKIRKFKR